MLLAKAAGRRNSVAARLARTQSAQLIAGLSATKKKVVARLISRGFDQGWTDARLKRELMLVMGLDQRRALSVQNYAAGLQQQGVSPGRASKMVEAYAKRLLRQRVQQIAETEVTNLNRATDRELMSEGQSTGRYTSSAVRVVRNSKTSNVCPQCRKEKGKRRSLKHTNGGPPFHPGCHCYEVVYDQGVIQKDIRRVRDVEYWGEPYGTPIVAGMKGGEGWKPQITNLLENYAGHDPGARGAFAKGLLDAGKAYPAVAEHIDKVNWSFHDPENPDSVAIMRTGTGADDVAAGKFTISVNLGDLRNAAHRTLLNWTPGSEPWSVSDRIIQSSDMNYDVFLSAMAYAVAVHEFGHVAHALHAMGTAHDRNFSETTIMNVHNWKRWEDPDIPVLSKYAQTNGSERFAEWFSAHFCGLNTGISDEYLKEIERHLRTPVKYDPEGFGGGSWVQKSNVDEHDTFVGSVVVVIGLLLSDPNMVELMGDF